MSLYAILTLGVGAGALTACGGSSTPAKSSDATTTSSATNTPTTKAATGAAASTEPASDPIAATAALKLSDVGAGYAEYRKAGGVKTVGPTSCSVIAPGAPLTTQDHVYSGPMFKKKDATFFAYSEAYTFRTEALAKKFATFRATAPYKQCKQKQDDAAQRKATPGISIRLTPVAWTDESGHIPSMYREQGGTTKNGKFDHNGFYDRYTVRRGRVIVVVNIDSASGRTDAESQAIAEQIGDILRALDTALTTRLAAA